MDTLTFRSLEEFLAITRESEQAGFEYTVAWIDCLSGLDARGIFYRGNHAPCLSPGGPKRTLVA